MRNLLFTLALVLATPSLTVFGQKKPPAPPAQTAVEIKSSPASDALTSTAKDLQTEQKSFDTALQQAKSALDASQKQLKKQLDDASKALNDELRKDKKYASAFAQIDGLSKQLQDAASDAQNKFSQSAGPIQTKINSDKALLDGLIPIVRKENGLPDTATFDAATQTWKK